MNKPQSFRLQSTISGHAFAKMETARGDMPIAIWIRNLINARLGIRPSEQGTWHNGCWSLDKDIVEERERKIEMSRNLNSYSVDEQRKRQAAQNDLSHLPPALVKEALRLADLFKASNIAYTQESLFKTAQELLDERGGKDFVAPPEPEMTVNERRGLDRFGNPLYKYKPSNLTK